MANPPQIGDRVARALDGLALTVVDVANPWPQGATEYRCEAADGETFALQAADLVVGGEAPRGAS